MDTNKPVRRSEAFDNLGQAITELQGSLSQLWEAIVTVEAVDAGRVPEPDQHASAITHLSSTCQEWQGSMLEVRDVFITWMLSVAQEHHEAMSGKELLKEMAEDESA